MQSSVYEAPWLWPRAAYLHIPFCAHHCGYCDFAVAVGQTERVADYLAALNQEMSCLSVPQRITTLYFGGGTPSLLSLSETEQLLQVTARWLPVEPGGEVSLEANPDDVTPDKARLWSQAGVTRISLGAQSFHPAVLQVLERRHAPAHVPRAVEILKRHGRRVGMDLIFGVPGQSPADWEADLERVLALEPDHISTYGLTYEKGTRLWKQQQAGQVQPLSDEAELAMYLAGKDRLEAASFEHYEVSNFALPGCRSRHNQVYWANHAHFGFGMGAASYIRGVRRLNTRDLSSYLRRVVTGRPTHFQEEELPPRERALETVATQLRRLDGIDRAAFAQQTAFPLDALLGPALSDLVDLELLEDDGHYVRLTRAGLCVADEVIRNVFKLESRL